MIAYYNVRAAGQVIGNILSDIFQRLTQVLSVIPPEQAIINMEPKVQISISAPYERLTALKLERDHERYLARRANNLSTLRWQLERSMYDLRRHTRWWEIDVFE